MRRRVLRRLIWGLYGLLVSKNRMPGLCRLLNAATSVCGARGVQEAFKRRRSVLSKTRQLKSMSYVWSRQPNSVRTWLAAIIEPIYTLGYFGSEIQFYTVSFIMCMYMGTNYLWRSNITRQYSLNTLIKFWSCHCIGLWKLTLKMTSNIKH